MRVSFFSESHTTNVTLIIIFLLEFFIEKFQKLTEQKTKENRMVVSSKRTGKKKFNKLL